MRRVIQFRVGFPTAASRKPVIGAIFAGTVVICAAGVGCSKSDSKAAEASAEKAPSGPPAFPREELVANEAAEPIAGNQPQPQIGSKSPGAFQAPPTEVIAVGPAIAEPNQIQPIETESDPPQPTRQLRGDLSPDELVQFLAAADRDMELIHGNRSGIEDPREARQTLLQIVNMKLQASRQLSSHAGATAEQKSEGNRGELQSLSHLAALSDVRSAEELEKLAQQNMSSDDPKLVADSRLVLIGFAIESLQNGKEQAADKIIQYVNEIASSDSRDDVPALIVMGQAKAVLESYGYANQAKQVRDTIIKTFADSSNPDVASMTAEIAGNVRFDGVDKLRGEILEGADVGIDRWVGSVETLIDESADLQTARYLAGAAVDFEANGMMPFAEATLQTLNKRFSEPDAATTREVQTAIKATAARQQIIGQSFEPDLPSIDGTRLTLADYRGKVVLVPFWAMGIPLSLQPIPSLQSICDANPDQVAMVGVNLDLDEAPLDEFLEESKISFPSFRLASDPASQIPRNFGMVSMPFVVIIDRAGKVAAIQLSEKNLQQTVQRLIAEP